MTLQCDGKEISWEHLRSLYEHDNGRGTGLALVPKLKFEHVYKLSSFAKMEVDLAAQVGITAKMWIMSLFVDILLRL